MRRILIDLRFAAAYAQGMWPAVFASITFSVALSLLAFPTVGLIVRVLDEAVPARDTTAAVTLCGALLGLRVFGSLGTLALRYLNIGLVERAALRLRSDYVGRLLSLPRRVYAGLDAGEVHTAVVADTARIKRMLTVLLSDLVPAAGGVVVLTVLLFALDVRLTLLLAVMLPPSAFALAKLSSLATSRVEVFHRASERVAGGMWFVVRALDLTRMQSFEAGELEVRRRELESLKKSESRVARLYATHAHVQSLIVAVAAIVVLVVGSSQVIAGELSLGALFGFYFSAGLLNQMLMTLMSGLPEMLEGTRAVATLRRIFPDNLTNDYAGRQPVEFDGSIRIEGVRFSYPSRDNTASPENSFELQVDEWFVQPGETVCVCGDNGAGKSTLAMLLLGFYRPHQGRLLAGNTPYDDVDISALRERIGVVPQNPVLFAASIADNVTYGRPAATREQIEHAAKAALLDEVVVELSDGFNTEIGEYGALLSGGQRQRIAIARALLGGPPLLVLDEPTTHLDLLSVQKLIASLKALPQSPGIVVISHDPALLDGSNRAYTVERGKVLPFNTEAGLGRVSRYAESSVG